MMFWLLFFLIALLTLAYYRAGIRVCSLVYGAALLFYGVFGDSILLFLLLAIPSALLLLTLNVPALRQEWIARPLFAGLRRVLQNLEPRTLAALQGCTAGWETDLLDGRPDWLHFGALPQARPTPDEQAAIAGLLGEFGRHCARQAQPQERSAWLHGRGAAGLGVPREYGGFPLSACGRSFLLHGLAMADPQAAIAIGASTRLAWIELLLRHGTYAQRERFLPLLSAGAESIGTSIEDLAGEASVEIAEREGLPAVALRLRLEAGAAPGAQQARLFGLRVWLRDPARMLEAGRHGVVCLVLERDTPGLDVAATLGGELLLFAEDTVVGGVERIGLGAADWEECRAVAVAISAPAVHAGAAATLALAAGGCARVHAPFAEPAGDMAAAQEALAVVAATTESSRALAAFAALTIDRGERPLGIAAFARAIAIQQARLTAAAAADIGVFHGALRGLIRWLPLREPAGEDPARLERATQYTRAVLRSHRAFMQALSAAREPNPALALARFDDALWEHIGHGLSSGVRALLLGVLVRLPGLRLDPAQRHRRAIDRYSAALAFAADVSLSRLAVDLASPRSFTARRGVREAARLTLTTWLGDALAELLLAMAALKRYEDEGSPAARRAQLDWICAQAYRAVEEAFDKVLRHLSSPALALLLRVPIFPLGRAELAPSDETNRQVAQSLMDTGYLNAALATDDPRLRPLAQAWNATLGGEALERGAAAASNAERPASARIDQALAAGALEPAQAQQLREWLAIMRELDRPAALSAEQSSTTP